MFTADEGQPEQQHTHFTNQKQTRPGRGFVSDADLEVSSIRWMAQPAPGRGSQSPALNSQTPWGWGMGNGKQNEEWETVHSKHLPLFASPLLLKPDYKRWSWDFLTRACRVFFILVYLSISVGVDGVYTMPRPRRQGRAEVVGPVCQRKKGQSRGRGRAKGRTTGLRTFLLKPVVSAISRQLGSHLALGVKCP